MINDFHTKPNLFTWVMLGFLMCGLKSCSTPFVFDQNLDVDQQSWSRDDLKEFTVPITDAQSSYTLYLNTRHTYQYPFENLALSIQESGPRVAEKTSLITFLLAAPDGHWKGKGSGNIFNNQVIYLKNHHFPDTGTYTFKVKPMMNPKSLPGIISIGLRVEKNHNR